MGLSVTVGLATALFFIWMGYQSYSGKMGNKLLGLFKVSNKTNKAAGAGLLIVGVLFAIGSGPSFIAEAPFIGDLLSSNDPILGGTTSIAGAEAGILASASCPDTRLTAVTVDVLNSGNVSGNEAYNVTMHVFDKNGGDSVITVTDTDDGSAFNVPCPGEYIAKVIATDAANGDNSRIDNIISGAGTINSNGDLEFSATSSQTNIDVGIDQQGTLHCAVYDNFARGNLIQTGVDPKTTYNEDGTTWQSTVNNTKISEGDGIDYTINCRANQTDTNWNDKGVYLLVEAPSATWDTPTVRVNGQKLSDIKGDASLFGSNEQKAWSAYEYVYFIDVDVMDAGEGMDIDFDMVLLSGVSSSSADPEFDIAVRGNYLSSNGVDVKTGGATDASSAAVVRSLHDITFDVT